MKLDYFKDLGRVFSQIEINDEAGNSITLDEAIDKTKTLILNQAKKGNKIISIGNGGSSAIANHITTDLLKNCKIPALSFSDSSLLTCVSNDLGYEHVYRLPIELLAKKGDVLFSISSCGKSKNILNAASKAKEIGCFIITLSGFERNNPLRKFGDVNFYVPSNSYGYVEITHLSICHWIVDCLQAHG